MNQNYFEAGDGNTSQSPTKIVQVFQAVTAGSRNMLLLELDLY